MQTMNVHPDRGGESSHAALINHAYAVLSNASARAEYDRELNFDSESHSHPIEEEPQTQDEQTCPFCTSGHQFEDEIPQDAFCVTCKGPLCPATQHRLEFSDQRKIARIGKKTTLSFFTQWPQLLPHVGVTENISKQGLLFVTSHVVAIESVIKINCTQFQTIARVENCRQEGNIFRPRWHLGASFITIHFRKSRGVFVSNMV